MNQSEIRMGYLPALLALDPEPRVIRETPPRDDSFNETSGQWLFRAFPINWTKHDSREVTEADCKQIKPSDVHEWEIIVGESVPEAAPPSAPKFKAGDRVRHTAAAMERFPADDIRCIVERSDDEQTWFVGGTWQFTRLLELAQDEAPAQPAGVWVLTSERKPPKIGAYMIRRQRAPDQPSERQWDGSGFLMAFGNQHLVSQENTEWLDTSPQPDAEGWIAHTPGPCPVEGGVMLEHKMRGGLVNKHECYPGAGGWVSGTITHYRVVK